MEKAAAPAPAKPVDIAQPTTTPTLGSEEEEADLDTDIENVDIEGILEEDTAPSPEPGHRAPSTPPPSIDGTNDNEEDAQVDFAPYIAQLAPSTLKILEDDFHAKFIHLIRPKKKEEA